MAVKIDKVRYGVPIDEWFARLRLIIFCICLQPSDIPLQTPWSPGYEYQFKILFRRQRNALGEFANRGGKTLMASWECLTAATFPNRRIWIVAATTYLGSHAFNYCLRNAYWLRKLNIGFPNFRPIRSNHRLELNFDNGSFIHVKSMRTPANLEGDAPHLIDLEELSNPETQTNWIIQFMPTRLIQTHGSFFGFYTPIEGGELRQWTLEQRERDDVYWVDSISQYEFPHIDNTEIDKLKASMPPDFFEERCMGKYTEYIGKVYSEFDLERHTFDSSFIIPKDLELFAGIDFGETSAFCAFELMGFSKSLNKYLILDEVKMKTTKPTVFGQEIIKRLKEVWKIKPEFLPIYGDDAATFPIYELQNMGLYNLYPAQKMLYSNPWNNYYLDSIRRINGLFRTDSLLISLRCEHLIHTELMNYIWDRKRRKPSDEFNDGLDAMRYGVWGFMLDSGWTVEELFGIYAAVDKAFDKKTEYRTEDALTPSIVYTQSFASTLSPPLPKYSSMPMKMIR